MLPAPRRLKPQYRQQEHEMSANTIHTWLSKYRKNGFVKTMPKAKDDRQKALEKQLKLVLRMTG
jgi:transposase